MYKDIAKLGQLILHISQLTEIGVTSFRVHFFGGFHSLMFVLLTFRIMGFFGLCPSSCNLETIKHSFSETESVSVLR
jgi:hypothetical protein